MGGGDVINDDVINDDVINFFLIRHVKKSVFLLQKTVFFTRATLWREGANC